MPSRPDNLPDAAMDEKFQEALRLHSLGDAVEPERLCHQILETPEWWTERIGKFFKIMNSMSHPKKSNPGILDCIDLVLSAIPVSA